MDLDQTYAQYLQRAQDRIEEARRASSPPCLVPWPADPPGPDYVGTRCARSEGHAAQGLHHGVRIGTQLLEWH